VVEARLYPCELKYLGILTRGVVGWLHKVGGEHGV